MSPLEVHWRSGWSALGLATPWSLLERRCCGGAEGTHSPPNYSACVYGHTVTKGYGSLKVETQLQILQALNLTFEDLLKSDHLFTLID